MNNETFDNTVKQTCVIDSDEDCIRYAVLNLAGEAGEITSKYAKAIRDKTDIDNDEWELELKKEIGDVLWCASLLATSLGTSTGAIMEMNARKVFDRKSRGTTAGSGDNR
jgi:NTP pyrophosphatase (non-canonical NTP hydrolase)